MVPTALPSEWTPQDWAGIPSGPGRGISPNHDLKERGFSSEQGLHLNEIDDGLSGSTRRLRGGSFQAEYTWSRSSGIESREPSKSQGVSPTVKYDMQEEWTLGAIWFSRGQRNKITADVSDRELDYSDAGESAARFQVRWDISF